MRVLNGAALCATLAATAAYAQNSTSSAPTVTLGSKAKVVGVSNATTGMETFLGIPYAQPPLGKLRFSAPVPATVGSSTTINATKYGPVCMQIPDSTFPFALSDMSEDCLTVNVIRPPGLNSTSKLPVLVWIYGGSFLNGGNPYPNTEPAIMVGRSLQLGEPIIFASFNYRLNSFGFLGSSEVAAAAKKGTAALNPGLYDIRLALQWIQQNIKGFGGDPDKVTVFGESAGAIAIGSMLVADKGKAVKKLGLFRGAIMESGAPSGDPVPPPSQLDSFYSTYVKLAGCSSAEKKGTGLACLRNATTATLFNATVGLLEVADLRLPFNRVVDGYFFTSSPSVQVRAKEVSTVPLMMGNNLDEGTIFAPTTVNNTAELKPVMLANLYDQNTMNELSKTLLPELFKLYPDNPAVGSPYNPAAFNVSSTDRFYQPSGTNQYKRLSAILGDLIFQAGRRILLDAYIARDKYYPVYNYLFTAVTPSAPAAIGVFHGSEIPYVYGDYAYLNASSIQGRTSLLMLDYWISFTNTLHPNRPALPEWPKYGTSRKTIHFTGLEGKNGSLTDIITDDYRKEGIAFLGSAKWCSAVNA